MDIDKIKQLIEMLEDSSLSELDLKDDDGHIRLNRAVATAPVQTIAMPAPAAVAAPIAAPAAPAAAPAPTAPAAVSGHQVKSPMVGTFYQAPSPDAKPFVTEGQSVKQGDVICIIEAMKMMNHIEADTSGTVKSILVKDGEAVEFDQPLVIIE